LRVIILDVSLATPAQHLSNNFQALQDRQSPVTLRGVAAFGSTNWHQQSRKVSAQLAAAKPVTRLVTKD
jgi:hypothetical protein